MLLGQRVEVHDGDLGQADAVAGGVAEAGVDSIGTLLRGFAELDPACLQLLI